MKILYVFCLLLFACNGVSRDTKTSDQKRSSVSPTQKLAPGNPVHSAGQVTYKIVNSIDSTYGYDIYIEEKRFIHQPNIPATSGILGFKRKIDAQKVAELVKRKIILGEVPPTVRIEEMNKLNLIL